MIVKINENTIKKIISETLKSFFNRQKTIEDLVKMIEKDIDKAKRSGISHAIYYLNSYYNSINFAIKNGFTKKDWINAINKIGLHFDFGEELNEYWNNIGK